MDINGNPWVVNTTGYLFFRTGSQWVFKGGPVKDIGVTATANGAVWVIAPDGSVYQRGGSSGWTKVGLNNVTALSVGPDGSPWVVDSAEAIRHGDPLVQVPNVVGMTKAQAQAAVTTAGSAIVAFLWDQFNGGA